MSTLIDALKNGKASGNLFDRGTANYVGINEFDLVYESGNYYFFLYKGATISVRVAPSIEELAFAAETDIITSNLKYPTAQFTGNKWHVMGALNGNVQKYYISGTNADPALAIATSFTLQTPDIFPSGPYDAHVRFNPVDSKWVCALKSGTVISIYTADAIGGPYTLIQANIFKIYETKAWFAFEQADPAPFFEDGKNYLTFAGAESFEKQRPCIVELDSNYLAIGDVVALVNPDEDWQTATTAKVFNPVYVNAEGKKRVYSSKNVAFAGPPALPDGGWGYIEARGPNLWSGEVDTLKFGANFQGRVDNFTGLSMNFYGNYSINDDGLTLTNSIGGAYGITGHPWLDDFTLVISLTPGTAIGNQLVFSLGKRDHSNYFGIYLDDNNNLYYTWGKTGAKEYPGFVLTGKTTVVFRKIQDLLEVWINGKRQDKRYKISVMNSSYYRIGNAKYLAGDGTTVTAAADQFCGTIHKIKLFSDILRQEFFNI